MSRFDEVRVAYTDDHLRRDLVGRSLTRHELSVEQHRSIVRGVLEDMAVDEPEAKPHKGYRPGDPAQLRGLPVVGTIGGLGEAGGGV